MSIIDLYGLFYKIILKIFNDYLLICKYKQVSSFEVKEKRRKKVKRRGKFFIEIYVFP